MNSLDSNRQIRVFISSTFRDMQVERDTTDLKYEIGHLHGFNSVAPIYFVEVPGWDSMDFEKECAAWIAELRKRQHFDLRPWHAIEVAQPRRFLRERDCRTRPAMPRCARPPDRGQTQRVGGETAESASLANKSG